jgi:hypothetical protein
MKPPFGHASQTALAALAAAASIWLSVFVLPGAGVQPIPLLPSIGGAAGRIAASVETPTKTHAPAPHRTVFSAPVLARPVASTRSVVAQPLVTQPRVVHQKRPAHRVHARRPQPRPSAPVQAAAPAPIPASTAAVSQTAAGPPMAKGKAKGHTHSNAAASRVRVSAKGRGHGKARGHSPEHHKGPPPGRAKKAAAPQAPPTSHGQGPGDQGHGGGKK